MSCVRRIKFHHDNEPGHRLALIKVYTKEQRIKLLLDPAYRLDLSPCDIWLNPYIKVALAVAVSKFVLPLEALSFQL
jgi:hypothetical protein